MRNHHLTKLLFATLIIAFGSNAQAQVKDVAASCAEAARALVNGSWPELSRSTPKRGYVRTELNWTTAEGYRGACRFNSDGRMYAVEVTQFPPWLAYSLTCESVKERRKECPLKGVAKVALTQQLSNSSCRQGNSWGVNGDRLWVDRGCRAVFLVSPSFGSGQGLSEPAVAALRACNSLVRSRGMTVVEENVVEIDSRRVAIEYLVVINRVNSNLFCRYDVQSRQPRLFGG